MTRILLFASLLLLGACSDDLDGDGSPAADDCDDADPAIHPGADERCDGLDDDCADGVPAEEIDRDGDGISPCQGDCDDANHRVGPQAEEVCDGLDNDCDGEVDEGFVDADSNGVLDCFEVDADGDGYRPWQGDCDDTDPSIHPGAPEICDGLDDDCDGYANADPLLEGDSDGDGHPTCDDCDDNAPLNFPGNPEACDGLDNNCDGRVDEGLLQPWYPDQDGDGHGAPGAPILACLRPEAASDSQDDCDDGEATVYPGHEEVCDGLDNDCDGAVDEGVLRSTWPDSDGDGFGVPLDVIFACAAGPGRSLLQTDCNDVLDTVHPGAPEVCDRLDDDCDGVVPLIEQDLDVDGQSPCEGDCDDTSATTVSGGPERCDGVDDDCDGQVDVAPSDELCPPGFGVSETSCVPGAPPSCQLMACEDGFWALNDDYGDGCECEDDDAGGDCSAALDLGVVQAGDVITRSGRLPDPGLEDWYSVSFPAGARPGLGVPSIALVGNPGDAYRLDLSPACHDAPFGCGETEDVSVDITSWSAGDDVSDALGFTENLVEWPQTVLVRVVRTSPGLDCVDYTLEISR